LAGKNNARRQLRAPYAGVVLHIWKRVGENVDGTSATPIVEIANTSTLELRAHLSASDVAKIREGQPAMVTPAHGGTPVAAKVARVSPAVDPATFLGTVRIQIDAPQALVVGSSATAEIVVAERPGLVVPVGALRRSMLGSDEIVVCEHNVAHVREVKIGERTASTAEILDGLAAGEQIVVDHALGIEDNQALRRTK
jgi:HlyD family secretion protein